MNPIVEVNVQSEIGKLNGVIIHTPGEEVENMTPENAERALYSDIINLSIARKEYKQISGVLSKLTKTYEVKDLLCNILKDDKIKQEVLDRIERIEPFIGEKSPKGSLKEQLLEENAEKEWKDDISCVLWNIFNDELADSEYLSVCVGCNDAGNGVWIFETGE